MTIEDYKEVMDFVRWIRKEGWYEHSSKQYWYQNKANINEWPPDDIATEKEVFEKFLLRNEK